METIPFTADPAQTLTVALGTAKYDFAARYNDAWGVWTFDITRTADQVELASQVPILIGQDLIEPYALQMGGIVATDLSGASIDAGPDDFGDRVIVTWLSPEELAAMRASGALP